ncbi:Nuclease-related domain-containing protein [Mesobacillus persicus]|uniref:Nuclease-related domain-containing protein n=1 Tax=Mesobacillus persicus TaxID=930146 RepID=A0A1H7Z3Q3_9BACI|nr:nuclease-related domain-containing protein [Mesobacillus persicus]SEM52801.1 Nuclease-related domain-containing protein [Mesobacillus persicus]
MNKNIKVIACYSEIMGNKMPKEDIIKLIKRVPLLSSFILLSQISSDGIDETRIKGAFKELYEKFAVGILNNKSLPSNLREQVYKNVITKFNHEVENNVVFSQQSILNLWKWLLAYGDVNNINLLQEKTASLSAITYLALATNDYLDNENRQTTEELHSEVFSNAFFNHQENTYNTLARTILIYTEIAMNKALYHENEFLDINHDFFNAFGYSIKEHIGLIFGLIACFYKPRELGSRWLQNPEVLLANLKFKDQAKDMLSSLTTNFKSISIWSKQKLDSKWDFMEFKKTPLIKLEDDQFMPFSLKLLYEHLFMGLYHKIRHIYPEDDSSFLTFYGKPFERYAQNLAQNSVNESKLPYSVITEFRYKKTKDSPDIMIRLNNKLLVIEVKSYRLTLSSITEAKESSINRDMEKMVISPLKQTHDRIKELIEIDHETVKGVEEYYLVVVNQGHFPTIPLFESRITQELESYFDTPINGYYHLDIEEFEMLCSLMEKRRPIFKVLDNKNGEKNKLLPFKTFLYNNSYHVMKNKSLVDKFDQIVQELGTIWFEHFSENRNKNNRV